MMKKRFCQTAAAAMALSLACTSLASAAPASFVSSGSIPYDEYFTENPALPGGTTFDRADSAASTTVPASYSYDTIVEMERGYVSAGTVVIHYTLDNQAKSDWFAGLNRVQLVAADGEGLYGDLTYTSKLDADGNGLVLIDANQKLLEQAGSYNVRAGSSASDETVCTTVRLVDAGNVPVYPGYEETPDSEDAPRIIINQLPPFEAGAELWFQIPGLDDSAVTKVTLVRPDGTVTVLPKETGYHFSATVLKIFGTDTESGVVYTPYSGVYKIIVEANGKQTSKKFRVENGADVKESQNAQNVDAISTASIGGGGMSGYIVFDEDLLSNALILKSLGKNNEKVDKVLEYYENYVPSYAVSEGFGHFYSFVDYMDKAMDAALNGGVLTFEEYRASEGAQEGRRPFYGDDWLQYVREDGTLGELIEYYQVQSKDAPALTSAQAVAQGQDLVLQCSDHDYLSAITKVFLQSTSPLDKDLYTVDAENGTLTLRAAALEGLSGDLKLRIYADGYTEGTATLQFGLPVGQIALKAANETNYVDEDVRITGMTTEFRDLVYDELLNNRYLDSDVDDGDCYVDTDGTTLVLKDHLFKTAGEYTLKLFAEGYEEPVEVTFTVTADESHPDAELQDVPPYERIGLDYYGEQLEVKYPDDWATEDAVWAYLDSVNAVTVNGKPLHRASGSDLDEDTFYASHYGELSIKSALDQDVNIITVEADGYNVFTFKVDKYGDVTDRKPGEPVETKKPPAVSNWNSYVGDLTLDFDNNSYVRAITGVTVNDEPLSVYDDYSAPDEDDRAYKASDGQLAIGYLFTADQWSKIVVSAEGYEDLTLAVQANYYSGIETVQTGWNDDLNKPETDKQPPKPSYISKDYFDESQWTLSFEEGDQFHSFFTGLGAEGASVTVNGKSLTETDSNDVAAGEFNYASWDNEMYFNSDDFDQAINTVTVQSPNYKELVFYVTKDGEITNQQPGTGGGETEEPQGKQPPVVFYIQPYASDWEVVFTEESHDSDWFSGLSDKGASVKVNDKILTETDSQSSTPEGQFNYSAYDCTLYFNPADFGETVNKVEIVSPGYQALTFYVRGSDHAIVDENGEMFE